MASVVYVKGSNGTIYAYSNNSYWDKKAKETKHDRKCIGHLDESTGEIVPNRKKSVKPPKQQCSIKDIGVSLLLNHVANETGLTGVLHEIFTDDWKQILTCAYYLLSEGRALSRIEQWSEANDTPYGDVITSQRASELLARLTGGKQMDFFIKWVAYNRNGEYYAMDITSVSSYSDLIDFVRYGHNRDNEKLPQVNLLMVNGETSHMPLYFRAMPGSIKDVSTLVETLDTLDIIDVARLHLVMDKGFYSDANIDAMYENHIRFLVGVPFTAGYARDAVQIARTKGIYSQENYRMVLDEEIYIRSDHFNWKGHRCYVHVYYDSFKAEMENRKFDRILYECFHELELGKETEMHKPYYTKFFHIKITPRRGRHVVYDQAAIDEHRRNTTGWFVMITNDVKDPVKALEIYRMKDSIEKAFDDLKNDLDCKRLRIHSTAAMEGRLFIQFIALILAAKIKLTMNANGWFKNYDMQQVIDGMKSLREVNMVTSRKRIISTPTALQVKIIQLFGIAV